MGGRHLGQNSVRSESRERMKLEEGELGSWRRATCRVPQIPLLLLPSSSCPFLGSCPDSASLAYFQISLKAELTAEITSCLKEDITKILFPSAPKLIPKQGIPAAWRI